jgi:hypothetical protein
VRDPVVRPETGKSSSLYGAYPLGYVSMFDVSISFKGYVMILNRDKIMFHANHMTRDDDGELVFPHVENFTNADVYIIGAYIYILIGVLSLTEYDVREYMTDYLGNTAIV